MERRADMAPLEPHNPTLESSKCSSSAATIRPIDREGKVRRIPQNGNNHAGYHNSPSPPVAGPSGYNRFAETKEAVKRTEESPPSPIEFVQPELPLSDVARGKQRAR